MTGEYRRVSDIVYDDRGARVEKITFFPMSTLTEISISQEDMKDLAGVQPFALTTEDIPKYQIDYGGKERVDELNTYTFNVKPKKLVEGELIEIKEKDLEPVIARVRMRMMEEITVEDKVNEEVRNILTQYQDEMRRTGISYQEMFKKVKGQIARDKKLILR